MLIYEVVNWSQRVDTDFYKVKDEGQTYYHLWSVMDIKKMIPVDDSVITNVDMVHIDGESDDVKKYKDLLNKEYAFLVKIKEKIIKKANKVYDKQTTTKNGLRFCCDFKALEKVAESFQIKKYYKRNNISP